MCISHARCSQQLHTCSHCQEITETSKYLGTEVNVVVVTLLTKTMFVNNIAKMFRSDKQEGFNSIIVWRITSPRRCIRSSIKACATGKIIFQNSN